MGKVLLRIIACTWTPRLFPPFSLFLGMSSHMHTHSYEQEKQICISTFPAGSIIVPLTSAAVWLSRWILDLLSVIKEGIKWPLGCGLNKCQENTLGFEALSINFQISEFEATMLVCSVWPKGEAESKQGK